MATRPPDAGMADPEEALAMQAENAAGQALAYRLLQPVAGETVLEVGAGPGRLLSRLQATCQVMGVDASAMMTGLAQGAAPGAIVLGNAGTLPVRDEQVHAVVAVHCLMLLPRRTIAEVRRVLRRGGRFVAVVRTPQHGGPEDVERDAAVARVLRHFTDVSVTWHDDLIAIKAHVPQ